MQFLLQNTYNFFPCRNPNIISTHMFIVFINVFFLVSKLKCNMETILNWVRSQNNLSQDWNFFYNYQKWLSSEFWIRNCSNSFSFLKRNETAKIKGLQKQCIDIRDNFALSDLSLLKWILWNVYIGENVSDQ